MDVATRIRGLQIAVRAAAGGGAALALAATLHLDYPIYAMLAAVIVTELSPRQTRALAVRRLVATAIGATCGALLVVALPPGAWSIALGILAAMVICDAIGARDGARVAGYICGIAMLAHGADPWRYALLRFFETVLGIAVAGVVSFVPKLLGAEPPPEPAS